MQLAAHHSETGGFLIQEDSFLQMGDGVAIRGDRSNLILTSRDGENHAEGINIYYGDNESCQGE